MSLSPEETEKVKELFKKYDINHNKVLEKSEFIKGFKELIKSLSTEEQQEEEIQNIAEEAVVQFDLDNNGELNLEEFSQLIAFLISEKGLNLEKIESN